MKDTITSKRQKRTLKTTSNHLVANQGEQGIALVMALLMGMVLMGGATALMVRMMGARKLSASESYQQLAEAAAVNGFNRILATLNSPKKDDYLGYLYLINNTEADDGSFGWDSLPETEEPCASKLTTAPDWHSTNIPLQEDGTTLRNDGSGNLRTYYRLRRYVGPSQTSSAQFEIEGIVKREGSQKDYEARSLLKRSLFVNSRVPTHKDWAVLAGRDLELDGLTRMDSNSDAAGGLIVNLLSGTSNFNNSNPDSCNASNLLALAGIQGFANPDNDDHALNASLANSIWPVKNINSNAWDIPNPEYFNADNTNDTVQSGTAIRIWSFSDNLNGNTLDGNYGLQCDQGFSPICSRPTSNDPDSQHSIPIDTSQIASTFQTKAVNGTACVNKRTWGKNDQHKADEIYQNPDKCDSTEDKWKSRVEWRIITGQVNEPTYTITLKDSDLCSTDSVTPEGDVCHIYIEQINLERSTLLIENSEQRPVVIHLETPSGAARRTDIQGLQNSEYLYNLSGTSKLCGVDALSTDTGNTQRDCNLHAERFILVSSDGDPTAECYANNKPATLRFGSTNLPAAMIAMPNGNVELNANNTATKAVIWANAICTGSNQTLELSTTSSDGSRPIISKAQELWEWAEERSYGRTVARGIRGTGFDTFSRW